MRFILCAIAAIFCSGMPARAEDAPPPDKSGYNLFNPVPEDQMRAFAPDRPTRSNGATTVDAGHFQYEADFVNWTYDRYNAMNTTTSNFTVLDPTLKLGLTNHTDLEISLAPLNFLSSRDRSDGTKNHVFGFGDIYSWLKINLIGNEGGTYALAIVPYVKAPTAPGAIGNRHWEGGGYIPLNINLPDDWVLSFQTEFDLLENSNLNGTYTNYQNVINIGHPISETVGAAVEFWSDVSAGNNAPDQYSVDAALTWMVKDNLQLDVGTNVGLNRATPDLQAYCGIAQRF